MKKTLAVLILSAVCVALLFAQEIGERFQTPESPQVAPEAQLESGAIVPVAPAVESAPVVPVTLVVKPVAVEIVEPVVVAVSVVEEIPVVEKIPETDVIGITDDMTAGAELVGGRISLTLKGVELREVVRLFSRLSNANIIVPDLGIEMESKRIDMNLDNVEWEPALRAILDTNGLELYEKIPGTEVYSIRLREVGRPEPAEIQVFKLNYASVDEVVKMVDVLVKKDGGQISTYPARNTIIAQGSAKLLNDLAQVIEEVDLPRQQVFIEAKFLELSDSASEQLGIDWNVLGSYSIGVNSISGSYAYDKSQTDNVNKYTDISGLPYEALDAAPSAEYVASDDSIIEDVLLDNGVDYTARPGSDSTLSRIFGITPTTEAIDSSVVGKTLGATLSADDFNVVLSALKEMSGAKVVSNPKIIVANEETATIQIGQKIPNIKGTTTTSGDSQTITTYELDATEPYFEDGIKVSVTPTVNTLDNITVRIVPTLDRLQEATTAPDNTKFYGKNTKTINTVFSLKSGQTAAIGGLSEVTKSDVSRKVPLLGDLPFLGRFFSYNSKSSAQAETIIFVTVGLANPDNISMDTGLPEDSTLAMRHQTTAKADRTIHSEELKILETMESERTRERLKTLRSAETKRLKKANK